MYSPGNQSSLSLRERRQHRWNKGSADSSEPGLSGADSQRRSGTERREGGGGAARVLGVVRFRVRRHRLLGRRSVHSAGSDPSIFRILEARGADAVIGSRVRLLGRHIRRRPLRHFLGRVFATCASIAIGLPVYDTQCGAKIFRNTERLRQVFRTPFRVNWTFDVEILARFLLLERIFGGPKTRDRFVEYPLERWDDVPGSKLKGRDFFRGAWEILNIGYWLRSPRAERRFLATLQEEEGSQRMNGISR